MKTRTRAYLPDILCTREIPYCSQTDPAGTRRNRRDCREATTDESQAHRHRGICRRDLVTFALNRANEEASANSHSVHASSPMSSKRLIVNSRYLPPGPAWALKDEGCEQLAQRNAQVWQPLGHFSVGAGQSGGQLSGTQCGSFVSIVAPFPSALSPCSIPSDDHWPTDRSAKTIEAPRQTCSARIAPVDVADGGGGCVDDVSQFQLISKVLCAIIVALIEEHDL